MVNDIYQFPTNLDAADAETNVPVTQSVPEQAERLEAFRTYHPIVQMGEQIRSYRATAVAEYEAATAKMSLVERYVRRPILQPRRKVTVPSLINSEAKEGGALFGSSDEHLFVLDDRNERIEQQYNDTVLDFVYANLDPKTGKPIFAIVYRVTNHSIDKIYHGQTQPLSVEELGNLLTRIETYRVMIRDKFYPIDAIIEMDDDVQSQENPFIPDTPQELLGAYAYAKTMDELREQALTKL